EFANGFTITITTKFIPLHFNINRNFWPLRWHELSMRTLLVDLNNFSRYPTLSIGYLTAILRNAGHEVEVLSPLSFGIHGFPRQVRENSWQRYSRFISHWSAVTNLKSVHKARRLLKRNRQIVSGQSSATILDAVNNSLARAPDVVLISAYTMYHQEI